MKNKLLTLLKRFGKAFWGSLSHNLGLKLLALLLAILLSIPLERFGAELPWEMPLMLQAAICTVAITATELVAGLLLNVWLGLGVWDYSHLPLNLWGQICVQYALLWYILCLIFIPVFDWLRYAVEGGERPRYT